MSWLKALFPGDCFKTRKRVQAVHDGIYKISLKYAAKAVCPWQTSSLGDNPCKGHRKEESTSFCMPVLSRSGMDGTISISYRLCLLWFGRPSVPENVAKLANRYGIAFFQTCWLILIQEGLFPCEVKIVLFEKIQSRKQESECAHHPASRTTALPFAKNATPRSNDRLGCCCGQ